MWSDQPRYSQEDILLSVPVGPSQVMLRKVWKSSDSKTGNTPLYSLTIGNLFGSDSKEYSDLEEAVVMFQKQVTGLLEESRNGP